MAFAERITAIKAPRILDVEGFFFSYQVVNVNLFQALENVRLGLFIQRLEKLKTVETRKQRKLRVGKERTKQLEDSFNSVGLGYHKQHGWTTWTS